jgi:hypothetical protein
MPSEITQVKRKTLRSRIIDRFKCHLSTVQNRRCKCFHKDSSLEELINFHLFAGGTVVGIHPFLLFRVFGLASRREPLTIFTEWVELCFCRA